jgi:hypothetical protein
MERRNLAEDINASDAAFRAQFDPNSPIYHQGVATPVTTGK